MLFVYAVSDRVDFVIKRHIVREVELVGVQIKLIPLWLYPVQSTTLFVENNLVSIQRAYLGEEGGRFLWLPCFPIDE